MVDKGKVDLFLPMLLNVYLLIKKKPFNKKICYKIKATKKHSHASVIISGKADPSDLFLCYLSHESIYIWY